MLLLDPTPWFQNFKVFVSWVCSSAFLQQNCHFQGTGLLWWLSLEFSSLGLGTLQSAQ